MNDLPQQQSQDTSNNHKQLSSSLGKEGEMSVAGNELPLIAVNQEIVMPKETVSAGVKVIPQTVQLPPSVAQVGLKPAGASVPVVVSPSNAIHLPLTDDQIAKALHESIQSSIRWLAEWCVRKIKMVHARVIRRH
ncbi:MAG: hypothetical protein N3A54_02280 [Patescibacteria group bacterium]|nr:hypothetical protein [Patescibacteria group bacterium]